MLTCSGWFQSLIMRKVVLPILQGVKLVLSRDLSSSQLLNPITRPTLVFRIAAQTGGLLMSA